MKQCLLALALALAPWTAQGQIRNTTQDSSMFDDRNPPCPEAGEYLNLKSKLERLEDMIIRLGPDGTAALIAATAGTGFTLLGTALRVVGSRALNDPAVQASFMRAFTHNMRVAGGPNPVYMRALTYELAEDRVYGGKLNQKLGLAFALAGFGYLAYKHGLKDGVTYTVDMITMSAVASQPSRTTEYYKNPAKLLIDNVSATDFCGIKSEQVGGRTIQLVDPIREFSQLLDNDLKKVEVEYSKRNPTPSTSVVNRTSGGPR